MSFLATSAHSHSRQRVLAPVHSPGDRSADCTGTDLRFQLSSILRVVAKVFRLLIPILVTKLGVVHHTVRPWPAVWPNHLPRSRHKAVRGLSASITPARMRAKRLGVCMVLGIAPSDDSRCKSGIQPRADENQYRRGQQDDSIVATQAEGARAASKHKSAQSIDHVRQGI